MTPTEIPIESLCRRLHLANAPRIYQALAERAEREQWSYVHFLSILFAEEVAHRTQTRLSRLTHKAGFPFFKTVDDFDFTFQSTLRLAMLGSYLSPDFVTEGRTLILNGKSSRGKTHLAIAIAYRAIQNGFEALFTTAAALIEDLSRASSERRLREALVAYTHPHVLVVDEVGYLSYGPDAANVLYHVVNARHLRRRAMVFTTNKSLRSWGKVLHDQDLADAIVERILERGRLITLDGPSMRTRHLELGDIEPEDELQPAIVSGIDRPEFPEPTTAVASLKKGLADSRNTLVAAVITLFAGFDGAVAANRCLRAHRRLTRLVRAIPTRLDRARRGAAVAIDSVGVVAVFAKFHDPVAIAS